MLLGQYTGKVGAKGRIAFPKKFRSVLGDQIVVTQGYENSLIVVSKKEWGALLEGTQDFPFTFGAARETVRFLLGGATEVQLDNKGRFIISSYLRDFAKIKSEVVFLGLSRYVEIWDKDTWEEYKKHLEKNIVAIAERLGQDKKE